MGDILVIEREDQIERLEKARQRNKEAVREMLTKRSVFNCWWVFCRDAVVD